MTLLPVRNVDWGEKHYFCSSRCVYVLSWLFSRFLLMLCSDGSFRGSFLKAMFSQNRSSLSFSTLQNSTWLLMDGINGEETNITLTITSCTWSRLVNSVGRDMVTWFPSTVKRKTSSYGNRLIFRNLVLGQVFKMAVIETTLKTYMCMCVYRLPEAMGHII